MALFRNPITSVLFVLIAAFAFSTPGCGMFPTTETLIGKIVENANSRRSEMVTPTGNLSDYQVYQKPDADAVVFEHKLKPDWKIDKTVARSEQFKADLVTDLNSPESRSALESGIDFVFLFVDASGNTICRHKVTAADF